MLSESESRHSHWWQKEDLQSNAICNDRHECLSAYAGYFYGCSQICILARDITGLPSRLSGRQCKKSAGQVHVCYWNVLDTSGLVLHSKQNIPRTIALQVQTAVHYTTYKTRNQIRPSKLAFILSWIPHVALCQELSHLLLLSRKFFQHIQSTCCRTYK